MNRLKLRELIHWASDGLRTIWCTWLRPAIATIGRGNFHVDRLG